MSAAARVSSDAYEEGLALSGAGRHAEAIEHFERALAVKPDDARVLFALGNTATALGMARPAEVFYRQVLAQDPHRLEALVNLANLLRTQGNFVAAEALLLPALARDPGVPELWLTLGSVYREAGDYPRAERHYREALKLRNHYPAALINLADLLADEGRADDAFALYDRALALDPKHAQARLNRAILSLLKSDLARGWQDYAARLEIENKTPVPTHQLAHWSGGSLAHTRLLVTAEQGIGDQIMFASVIPDLLSRAAEEGGTVVLECEPRLVDLFSRSFARATVRPWDLEKRAGSVHARYGWLKNVDGANAAIELGSLPLYFRASIAAFPRPHVFLKADDAEKRRWRTHFQGAGPGPFVGVCWRSGDMAGHRVLQYAPLEDWAAFIRDLPGTIVCVQYDARPDEIAQLEFLSARKICVPPALDQKNELDRACAMVSALDAVVTAPTSVAWQAAGLGLPTAKVLFDTSWTSFGLAYEPFAPSCICAAPVSRGHWASAFAIARRRVIPLA